MDNNPIFLDFWNQHLKYPDTKHIRLFIGYLMKNSMRRVARPFNISVFFPIGIPTWV